MVYILYNSYFVEMVVLIRTTIRPNEIYGITLKQNQEWVTSFHQTLYMEKCVFLIKSLPKNQC